MAAAISSRPPDTVEWKNSRNGPMTRSMGGAGGRAAWVMGWLLGSAGRVGSMGAAWQMDGTADTHRCAVPTVPWGETVPAGPAGDHPVDHGFDHGFALRVADGVRTRARGVGPQDAASGRRPRLQGAAACGCSAQLGSWNATVDR